MGEIQKGLMYLNDEQRANLAKAIEHARDTLAPRMYSNRILIYPLPEEETRTKGGIILTDKAVATAEGIAVKGYVLAISKGIADGEFKDGEVNVGDIVLYSAYAGSTVMSNTIEYKAIRQSDLICAIA